jgi:hypothetical protein
MPKVYQGHLMSDEQREGFSHGYRGEEDRNGDGIPDREQQGYDPSTGRRLDENPNLSTEYNLDFAQNGPFKRETRESTAHLTSTWDTSRENSRDHDARATATDAVDKQSAVERAIESKPQTDGPGFAEKEMARNLWQDRARRPKKNASLLKKLGSVKTGHHEPKTGTEFAQSFLHGLGAGLMLGVEKQKEKKAQLAYDTTEEWMLDQARAKDQDAANEKSKAALDDAARIRDAVLAGATPPAADAAPGGDTPGGGTPGGDGPTGGPDGGPGGPGGGPGGPGSDETTRTMEPAQAPTPANDVGPERTPEREPLPAVAASGKEQVLAEKAVETQKSETKQPDAGQGREAPVSSSVDPARANGNIAAGAILSTAIPVAGPLVTAGAARHAQKEAGAEHQVQTRAKGPNPPARDGVSPPQREPGAPGPRATATRTLAPAPTGPRRAEVVSIDDARHRKGGLHAQAAALQLPKQKSHSKGPSVSIARRPAAGIGTQMAKAILAARPADDRMMDIARDKRAASR